MAQKKLRTPLPRQHGAWALLYGSFILAAGTSPFLPVRLTLLLAAITGVFLAHEPLTKLIRVSRHGISVEQKRHWTKWLCIYLPISGAAGIFLTVSYQKWWLPAAGFAVAAFLAAHLAFIARKMERTLGGELLGTLGLTATAPVSHYVLSGQATLLPGVLWALAFLYFASGVFHVKLLVSRFLKPATFRSKALQSTAYHLALPAILISMAQWEWIPAELILAYLPAVIRAFLGIFHGPDQLNLRRIGFTEVGLTILFLILFVSIWNLS